MLAPSQTAGLIGYQDLLHLIAKTLHPDPPALFGLPGVLGKRRFHPDVGVHAAREPISAEDQDVLRALLLAHEDLPPLRPLMNDREVDTFLRAYRALPARPSWEPALCTEHDVAKLRSLRQSARQVHDAALKEAIRQGRMRHFDIDRMAVMPNVHLITYVPREDVQSYLRPMALDLQAMLHGQDPVSVATPVISVTHLNTSSVSLGATSPGLVPQGQQQPRRQWSAQDRNQLMESVRSGQLALVVQHFGISAQYARQLASRFEKEEAARFRAPPAVADPDADAATADTSPKAPAKVHSDRPQGGPASAVRPMDVQAPKPAPGKMVLRMPEVERRIGIKRSSIYARLDPHSKYHDPTFPRPVSLSGRSIGFHADELDQWLAARPKR